MNILSNISEVAKETIWPTRCAICDEPGTLLCKNCRNSLLFVDSCKACKRCGAPYGWHICTECNETMIKANGLSEFPLDALRHVVTLDDNALRIIRIYKDSGEKRLRDTIASFMANYIEPSWIEKDALITFVPATSEAMQKRGFDHMEEISMRIGYISNLEVASLFLRPKAIDQRGLGRKERLANMKTRFSIRKPPKFLISKKSRALNLKGEIQDERSRPIVIVDDVCTSGATLYSASLTLKNAGYKQIFGLTFGRVLG